MSLYNQSFDFLEDKRILTTSATFGLLRKELIMNLGVKRAKGFLLRYGWRLGESHVKELMVDEKDIVKLLDKASLIHLETGQISGVQTERSFNITDQQEVKEIYATGTWFDSFEAKEHIKNHGISEHPVCHTLTGYASGYMTTACRRKIYVKEVTCKAMGDNECTFEMRVEEEWNPEMLEEIKHYEDTHIIDELKYTYEQLLEQRNNVEKISTFHNTLTQKILDGANLEEITSSIFDLLDIPVSIEDLSFKPKIYKGISDEEYNNLNEDLRTCLVNTSNGRKYFIRYDKTNEIIAKKHNRIISPIIIQKQIIGYVTFILPKNIRFQEQERSFIERAASVISLCFLNEKTSLEAFENMKGYFLEQLLLKQYTSRTSVVYRGYYIGIHLDDPFYIGRLICEGKVDGIKEEDVYQRVMKSIIQYLEMQGYKILICQFEGSLVILLPKVVDFQRKLENMLKHLHSIFPKLECRIGLSNVSNDIEMIKESLDEADVVLRMGNGSLVKFEEMSIIGTLINSKNMKSIRRHAMEELQPIFQLKKQKQQELFKTLYVFLGNGGNLQLSMKELSLSMSGLMYRISKLEEYLNKDLRNPKEAFELWIILDALKVLGDIDLE
ncbi:V4R domain-containing protein [Psychrobacillus sp. FJAT-51614]|uniref:V4R domain-containing protein n=1 Tax=Psychrobacillus mangrovi TaxID=3117745 RepID=A0ABU8F9U4_9BACI